MTEKIRNFLGQTQGAAVTVGNSDDFGDPALGTFAITGGTATYDSTGGVAGVIVSDGGTAANTVVLGETGFSGTSFSLDLDITVGASLPSSTAIIGSLRNSGGQIGTVGISSTGKLFVAYPNGAGTFTSTTSLAVSTRYSIRLGSVIDSAAGSVLVGAYPYNSDTPIAGTTASPTGLNTGSSAFTEFRWGKPSAAGAVLGSVKVNRVRVRDTTATLYTQYAAPAPPTITAAAFQTITNPGSSVTLSATATPNGSATIPANGYSWTPASWPPGTSAPTINNPLTASPTFTPTARGRYTFSVVATDSLGQVTPVPGFTGVNIPDTVVQIIEFIDTNGWILGQPSDLSDNSDTTKEDSGGVGGGTAVLARLAPLVPTTSGFQPAIRSYVDATAGTQRIELVEAATTTVGSGIVRFTWTITPPTAAAFAGNPALADIILADPGATALGTITDWNRLFLRFTQV